MVNRKKPSRKGSLAIKEEREKRKGKKLITAKNLLIGCISSFIVLLIGTLCFECLPEIEIIQPIEAVKQNPLRPEFKVKNMSRYSLHDVKGWIYIVDSVYIFQDESIVANSNKNFIFGITNKSEPLRKGETTSIYFDIWRFINIPGAKIKSIDVVISISYYLPFGLFGEQNFKQRFQCDLLNAKFSWSPISISKDIEQEMEQIFNELMELKAKAK